MKFITIKKIPVVLLLSLLTQFSMANNNASALSEIAGILADMKHFPSDSEKTRLMAISEDETISQDVRDMATAVANIRHFPNDEGKEAMARIIADEHAPKRVKKLASIIANFAHMLGSEDYARLEAML